MLREKERRGERRRDVERESDSKAKVETSLAGHQNSVLKDKRIKSFITPRVIAKPLPTDLFDSEHCQRRLINNSLLFDNYVNVLHIF